MHTGANFRSRATEAKEGGGGEDLAWRPVMRRKKQFSGPLARPEERSATTIDFYFACSLQTDHSLGPAAATAGVGFSRFRGVTSPNLAPVSRRCHRFASSSSATTT